MFKLILLFLLFFINCNSNLPEKNHNFKLELPNEKEIIETLKIKFNKNKIQDLLQSRKLNSIEELKQEIRKNISESEIEFYYKKYKPENMQKFGEDAVVLEFSKIKNRLLYAKIFKEANIIFLEDNSSNQKNKSFLFNNLNDPEFGNSTAKVQVIEFSDFGCHYCSKSQIHAEQIREKYKNKISWIFKDLPDEEINSKTFQAHIFANCIYKKSQNKFYPFFQLLYKNYKNLEKENLSILANEIGINSEIINFCFIDKNFRNQIILEIKEDILEATKLNIRGTPSYLINGKLAIGEIDLDKFIHELKKSF